MEVKIIKCGTLLNESTSNPELTKLKRQLGIGGWASSVSIKTKSGRIFLFDPSPYHVETDLSRKSMEINNMVLMNNLSVNGISPEQIHGIILSHLHLDHMCLWRHEEGNTKTYAPLFPQATIYIPSMVSDKQIQFFFYDNNMIDVVKVNDGDNIASEESIISISTPGHCLAHQSLVLSIESNERIICAGDSVISKWHFLNRDKSSAYKMNTDYYSHSAMCSSMERIEAILCDSGSGVIIPGHSQPFIY